MKQNLLTSVTSMLLLMLSGLVSYARMPYVSGEQSNRLSDSPSTEVAHPYPGQKYKTAFGQQIMSDPIQAPRALYTADNGVTVWGNIVYSRAWDEAGELPSFNAYSFSSDNGLTINQIAQDKWMFANGSGAFYDGRFRFISKGYGMFLYGLYDVDTWTQLYQEMSSTRFLKLVATDCDYDPVTGLTYGCFWNPDKEEYEFASVDYESCTHTTISPMEIYSAIAINSKGVVYGIRESDGALCRIDKTTGEETFIGNTGVRPYNLQSAAFDRSNDVLYWAVRSVGSVAYLATVNTDNASVRRLAYFPDSEQITCLYVPSAADSNAPAKVKDLTITSTGKTNLFKVEFTLPSTTSSGSLISGDIDYTVTLATESVLNGTARAGSKVSSEISLEPGFNAITVYASNGHGKGIIADRRIWNGEDTPVAVRDVMISIDNNNNNQVTVSWKAPEYGIHNGYIGAENLSFDVVRMPDNIKVSSRQATTTFTEQIGTENAGVYYYVITPYAGDIAGEAVETGKISAIGVFAVPFKETFDTAASFNSFLTLDSNGDYKTWFWNDKMMLAEYYVNWNANANDWLLTPEISMHAGKLYVLSFDYRAWSPSSPEYLRVAIGKGTDVSSYKDIIPTEKVDVYELTENQQIVSVDSDGAYRIGFQCTSPKTSMYVLVDNISVTEGPDPAAPSAPTDLTILPDTTGLLNATIRVTAPSTRADGNGIRGKLSLLVYRNGSEDPVKTFEDVYPGSDAEYVDETTLTGINTYEVVAVNSVGRSLPITRSAYIGQDRPEAPVSVTVTDNRDHLTLSWAAPSNTGLSWPAGPVIPEDLTYNVYAPDRSLICEGITDLSYDLPESYITGTQNVFTFYVSAVSPAGEGTLAPSNSILAGKPYDLPFRESFKNGTAPETYWWVGGYNVFLPTSEISYDGDGGCICWKNGYSDKNSWFNSAKLNIAPAEDPVFSFAYLMNPGKKFVIKAYVSPDGGNDVLLGEIDFSTANGDDTEWRLASFDLSKFKNSDYVIVKLYVECGEVYSYYEPQYFYVDQIGVTDVKGANLTAASITAPADIFINQTAGIRVVVENSAASPASFTLNLLINGETAQTFENDAIAPASMETVSFEYTPDVTVKGPITLQAEIICKEDLYPSDNKTDVITLDILRPDYPVVTDLSASMTSEGISITWSEPVQTDEPINESFEDYIHKDTRFGLWSTIDNDRGDCYTNQIVDVGFMNIPVSWVIFNTIAAGVSEEDAEYYAAHSGTTAALALLSQPETINSGTFTDDWLISPEISTSEAHPVTFWAKSVKGDKYGSIPFEVLYTKGYSNNVDDFVKIADYSAPADWKQFSVTVPAGSRFFAIRFLTQNGLYMMVDDIEYSPGTMDVTGYSLFRDGVKIADLSSSQTEFTDNEVSIYDNHTYQVTVSYSNGESDFSDPVLYSYSAIDTVTLPEGTFDVYSVDGIRVRHNATSLEGLPKGFYIVNNVKIAIL